MRENSSFKDLELPFQTRRINLPVEIPESAIDQTWSYTGVNTNEVPSN